MPNNSSLDQLMNNLPSILLNLKSQQTQKQQADRQFQFQQQQAAQQKMQAERERNDRLKAEKEARIAAAKKDKISIYTELIDGEDDPFTKSKFMELLSGADPENAGTYESIANTYREKGEQENQQWNLFRNYTTGKTSPEEFWGNIDFKSDAYEQAVKFEKANGKEVSSYGGWITVLDTLTGDQKDYKIGGEGNISFYEENYNTLYEFKNSNAYNWAPADEKARVDGALKHYGEILKDKGGLDLYNPNK